MSVAENYRRINQNINDTCLRIGRNPAGVKLLVVTKNQPAWKINAVLQAGAHCLGENYPEQLEDKISDIDASTTPEWHMIGHLQSRKIKYIIKYFSMVHSIDNLDTAQKLNNACKNAGIAMPICIEVNIAGEESKNGINVADERQWNSVVVLVEDIHELSNVRPVGLMTMPPFNTNPEINRAYFQKCAQLLSYINQKTSHQPLYELSMGTSIDYVVALEEGSTIVRIGEAIMGAREK